MGKPTSHIDLLRSPGRRVQSCRGYTLIEAMLASVLLSVTVLAVSGAISASYSQDEYAAQHRAALASGTQLLDEISALPLDAAGTDPSVNKYATYSDEADIADLKSVVGTSTASASTSEKKAKRTVSVVRKTGPSGADSATGDFATVCVVVQNSNEDVCVKRMITSAEANAGQ